MTPDPVTLAREVLARDAEATALDDRVGYGSSDSLYIENGWCAPALARVVVSVAELADWLDRLADEMDLDGVPSHADKYHAEATRIRTVLNEETPR